MLNIPIEQVIFYVILLIVSFFIIKLIFPFKKKETIKKEQQSETIDGKNKTTFQIIVTIIFIIIFYIAYKYLEDMLLLLHDKLIHSSRLPLIIQASVPFSYVFGIFLFGTILYLIYSFILTKTDKNLKADLTYHSSTYGFDVYKLYAALNALMLILFFIFLAAFVWSFDEYLIANEEGIYYNPIESFGSEIYYPWDQVDKIILVIATIGKDGNIYPVDQPYYVLSTENDKELPILLRDGKVLNINLIKQKSGAQLYERYGDTLTLKNG